MRTNIAPKMPHPSVQHDHQAHEAQTATTANTTAKAYTGMHTRQSTIVMALTHHPLPIGRNNTTRQPSNIKDTTPFPSLHTQLT